MRFLLTLTALLCLSLPALAQDYESLLALPKDTTVMNLSASERVEVDQDLLTATLRFQVEDKDTSTVQNSINETMRDALDEAKKVKSVKAATLRYNIYQFDRNQGKKGLKRDMLWRGEQSLQLKGKDSEALLKLVGKLQKQGLLMNGLQFSVSADLREATTSALLEKALERLTEKARRAGKALGKSKVDLLQVNVGQSAPVYEPKMMMRSMAMDSSVEMAAPVAAAGTSDISLNVTAVAILKP